jgi:Tfp pilus assembly protein PilO
VKAKLAALDLKIQLAGVVVVVGLLGFVGHMLLVSPQSASVAKIQTQIDDEQTQIYRRRALLKSGQHPPTIQTADLFRLARAMPDREDMPGIILTLSQVAQSAGIKFDLIEPVLDPVASAGSYSTHRIHLKFNGDFYGLSDFLFRLRSLVAVRDGKLLADGRLFNVDTLTFKMQDNTFPKISAELFVQAYVYSGATGAAAAPTTAPLTTPSTGTDSSTTPSGPPPTTPPTSSPTGATALGAS